MLRQSLTLFVLLLKNQLRRISYVAVLILLPLILLAASVTGIINYDVSNRAGIYVDGNDPVAMDAARILEEGDYMVKFRIYDSLDKMKTDIVNGRIDCGYVFPDTLTEDLINREKKTVPLYLNDSETVFTTYANEVVFSGFLKAGAGRLMTNYMENSEYTTDEMNAELDESFKNYIGSDMVFSVVKEDVDDNSVYTVDKIKDNHETIFRYLAAVIVMIAALNGAIKRTGEMKSSAFETMNRNVLRLSCFAYPTAYCLPVAISLLMVIFATDSSIGPADIINILTLVIASGIFAGIMGLLIKSPRVLAGTVPVLIMLMFFIYPIILDFSMFSHSIEYIRYFFPPQFINLIH